MSDNEEYGEDFFQIGESILIHLENGDYRLGEYVSDTDFGLCIKLDAKTEIGKPELTEAEKYGFQVKIAKLSENEIMDIYKRLSVKDYANWISKRRENDNKFQDKNIRWTLKVEPGFIEKAAELEIIEENKKRKTVRWMRHLQAPIRTMIMWHTISSVESAQEVVSENDFYNLSLELNNFNWKEGE